MAPYGQAIIVYTIGINEADGSSPQARGEARKTTRGAVQKMKNPKAPAIARPNPACGPLLNGHNYRKLLKNSICLKNEQATVPGPREPLRAAGFNAGESKMNAAAEAFPASSGLAAPILSANGDRGWWHARCNNPLAKSPMRD